jgi:hypothetical protein
VLFPILLTFFVTSFLDIMLFYPCSSQYPLCCKTLLFPSSLRLHDFRDPARMMGTST